MIVCVECLRDQLAASPRLSFLSGKVYEWESNWPLVEKGKAPFANIEGIDENQTDVPNMSIDDAVRLEYRLYIHFCQKSKDKIVAAKGDLVAGKPGIWDIKTAIWNSIMDDYTLGGYCRGILSRPLTRSGWEMTDDGLFVAIARMEITFYRDVFRR